MEYYQQWIQGGRQLHQYHQQWLLFLDSMSGARISSSWKACSRPLFMGAKQISPSFRQATAWFLWVAFFLLVSAARFKGDCCIFVRRFLLSRSSLIKFMSLLFPHYEYWVHSRRRSSSPYAEIYDTRGSIVINFSHGSIGLSLSEHWPAHRGYQLVGPRLHKK